MGIKKIIKVTALNMLHNAYHGVSYDEWCNKVMNKLKEIDSNLIEEQIKKLIENCWKVEYVIKNGEKIYVHLELIK